MASSVDRGHARVALVATCALLSATPWTAAGAQARGGGGPPGGGGPSGGFGRPPFGAGGGSFVRIGRDALQGQDPPNTTTEPVHEPSSLREALFGARGAKAMGPAPGRYEAETGRGFMLDRQSSEVSLVRFENSPEIWALTATPGPRGDIIFKNDAGEPVLRATRIGGLTLFTDDRPEGVAVAAAGGVAASLRPPTSIGPQALLQALAQASARASHMAQHLVVFDAPDVKAETDWAFADAAWVTSEAFVRVVRQATSGRGAAARFLRVNLSQGRAPDVTARGQVLRITITPDRGPAGRPSSERIMLAMTGR